MGVTIGASVHETKAKGAVNGTSGMKRAIHLSQGWSTDWSDGI